MHTAILVMNYGGPEGSADCEPYLRNIFLDPDLIPIPSLIRPAVVRLAARRRAPKLRRIYEAMGRFTPTLAETRAQAEALERELGEGYRCFVGMRYWKPSIETAVTTLMKERPERVVLLPLYPQESKTTTGSALKEARRVLEGEGFAGPVLDVRSFWRGSGFQEALAEGVGRAMGRLPGESRVLFCAHGLPLSVAKRDPYPRQVAATVLAVGARAGLDCSRVPHDGMRAPGASGGDSVKKADAGIPAGLAWQSRVGPMRWLEPSVEEALEVLAKEGAKGVAAVPVAFVNEHSETLYELDILYRERAEHLGMAFERVPTPGTHPGFIHTLAERVEEALS